MVLLHLLIDIAVKEVKTTPFVVQDIQFCQIKIVVRYYTLLAHFSHNPLNTLLSIVVAT